MELIKSFRPLYIYLVSRFEGSNILFVCLIVVYKRQTVLKTFCACICMNLQFTFGLYISIKDACTSVVGLLTSYVA